MAITEQQRHRLLTWFEEQMGPDLGAMMMELLPPGDASQLTTKADLAELRNATKSDIAELRNATRTDIAELRNATKTDIAELRAEVKDDMLQLQRTFITWLVASQGAVIAAIGVATGLVLGLS